MKKTYILDTNILLYDPRAIFKFEDNEVVIPIPCIEELDHFKKLENETGRNARQVSRFVDALRGKGSLAKGVPLDGGGSLRVFLGSGKTPPPFTQWFTRRQADGVILGLAFEIKNAAQGQPVIFLTKDTNLRIRADALGIPSEDYESLAIALDELYAGWREVTATDEQIEQLHREGEAPWTDEGLMPNEFLLIRSAVSKSRSVLARMFPGEGKVRLLKGIQTNIWGIQPRNLEQTFALDALLDDTIRLVTLVGKAGTGKTLLAIAAGLKRAGDEGSFNRVLVSRPIFPMGRDVGYLPGTLDEKLQPWMQPIFDNVELIMGSGQQRKRGGGHAYQEVINMGLLAIEPLTYIRGRSIPNQYLIVDEAQNLTPHEIKTIVTRCGNNTKMVVTGDPYQIDNPYVDSSSNGLIYLVDRFKKEPLSAHVTLTKGERSALAELASNLL